MQKALQYVLGSILIIIGIAGLFLPLLQGLLLIFLGVVVLKAPTLRGVWGLMKEKKDHLRKYHPRLKKK